MPLKYLHTFLFFVLTVSQQSCITTKPVITTAENKPQSVFWNELTALCGKAFGGVVLNPTAADSAFTGKTLVMHVRGCRENVIKVPFMVGDNRSRTWVLTRSQNGIELKHDHRHEDGTEDAVTQYGGITANHGSSTVQMFPADQHTANILPAAATNVWWIEVVPGKSFIYNLRRIGTERLFRVQFDITKPIAPPEAPWGWKD